MTRPPARQLAARAFAARKSKAGIWSGRGRGPVPARTAAPADFRRKRGTGVRPPELPAQIGNLLPEQADLLAKFRKFVVPGGVGPAQFSPELVDLPGQVIDADGALGNIGGSSADEDAFARVTDHEPGLAELGHRGPDHRDGDLIPLAQPRGRGDGRSDWQLTRDDASSEVVGDPLILGTPGEFGHVASLPMSAPTPPGAEQDPLTAGPQPTNLMHKEVHGAVDCCGPLGTRMDANAPAVITGETGPPPRRSADVSMQQVTRDRGIKDYYGSVHLDDEDLIFHGKVEFIRALISYEATDAKGLRKAFEEAVDDYLDMCVKQKE